METLRADGRGEKDRRKEDVEVDEDGNDNRAQDTDRIAHSQPMTASCAHPEHSRPCA